MITDYRGLQRTHQTLPVEKLISTRVIVIPTQVIRPTWELRPGADNKLSGTPCAMGILLLSNRTELKIITCFWVCVAYCAFCVQILVPAVDGSRLPGVGNARVYRVAWCRSLSPSHQPCLPCWHSARSCYSTSEWPCIVRSVDQLWLVTY